MCPYKYHCKSYTFSKTIRYLRNYVVLFIFIFIYSFIYLFIHLWLCWVFVSVQGLSLVVASGGHSSSQCMGLSLSRPLLLWSTGSRRAGSAIVAHRPSRSTACGILPDQGSNPCPLHWQADSQPLRHQGSPVVLLIWDFWTKKLQWLNMILHSMREQSSRVILYEKLRSVKQYLQ